MAKQRYAYTTRRQREELEAMVAVMLRFFNLGTCVLIHYEREPEDPSWIASFDPIPGRDAGDLCIRRDFYGMSRAERLQTVAHEILHAADTRLHTTVLAIIDQLPEGPPRELARELYKRDIEFFIDGLAEAILKQCEAELLSRVDRKLAEYEARRKSRQTPAAPAAGRGESDGE